MVKKYYKARGRPPVLMEEEEYDMMIKSLEKPAKKKTKKESNE